MSRSFPSSVILKFMRFFTCLTRIVDPGQPGLPAEVPGLQCRQPSLHRRHPRHGSHRAIAYKSPSSAAAAAVSALSSAVCCGRTIGTQMPHA